MYELKGPVNETLPLPDDEVLDIELERMQAEEAKPVGRRRSTKISAMFEDRELFKRQFKEYAENMEDDLASRHENRT